MVPSSALAVAVGGERLSCDGFSLSETIRFGNLEIITNGFGGLSLSPWGRLRHHRHGSCRSSYNDHFDVAGDTAVG
jgi:hypothetical protein